MEPAFKDKIVKEIEKTGFPLELELVEKLRRAGGIIVLPNISFQDDNGFIHELDLVSIVFNQENDWSKGPVGIQLLTECKKSEKYPWLFFEEVFDPSAGLDLISKAEYSSDLNIRFGFNLNTGIMTPYPTNHHYNDYLIPRARTYFEAFREKPNEPTSIYKAINNILHGRKYLKEWFKKSKHPKIDGERTFLNHYLIVLEGRLLLATKNEKSFDVNDVNHILLTAVDTNEKQIPKLLGYEIVIDVITREYFSEYLKIIKNDVRQFNEHLLKLENSEVFQQK